MQVATILQAQLRQLPGRLPGTVLVPAYPLLSHAGSCLLLSGYSVLRWVLLSLARGLHLSLGLRMLI